MNSTFDLYHFSNTKVFVAGATGILGRRVVRLLKMNDMTVVALVRSKSNHAFCQQEGIEGREGDIFNVDSLKSITKDVGVILNLSTSIPTGQSPKKKDWELNDRIRTEGVGNIMQAAKANSVGLVIQPSVTFLYGDQQGNFVSEKTPPGRKLPSMILSAVEMEAIVSSSSGEAFKYIIPRFGMFYSEDSSQTSGLLAGLKMNKIPIIGSGDFYWNFIHADDAASAILYCLQHHRQLANETVHFSDFNPIKFSDMVTDLTTHFKAGKPKSVPRLVASLALGKDTYRFLTSSYRLSKRNEIMSWAPEQTGFLEWARVRG